jgi:hypothetical protein
MSAGVISASWSMSPPHGRPLPGGRESSRPGVGSWLGLFYQPGGATVSSPGWLARTPPPTSPSGAYRVHRGTEGDSRCRTGVRLRETIVARVESAPSTACGKETEENG